MVQPQTTDKVKEAIRLFIETEEIPNVDPNRQPTLFRLLYLKECKLFDLMATFTNDEKESYRNLVEGYEQSHKELAQLPENYKNGLI